MSSSSDSCRRLLQTARGRVKTKTNPRELVNEQPEADARHNQPEEDEELVTVSWIVANRPSYKIVREFFAAQAEFQTMECDDQFA